MLVFKWLLSVLLVAYIFLVFAFFSIKKTYLKVMFINSIMGVGLLFLLKILEGLLQLNIYINSITVLSSLIFGPIGVIFNVLIDYVII